MTIPRDRFVLRSHEPQDRPGPGRRQRLIGMESFGPHQIADLLLRVEELLLKGYILSLNPPAEPPTEDVTASDCTIDVVAS